MSWQRYSLIFRLLAPLHIGYRKVGNLQQTRGYVLGKSLWAALTARLTRNQIAGATGKDYQRIGKQVEEHFRFTYFYPALEENGTYKSYYPWESHFEYRFLSSYASTALDYNKQSAADALLHEVEFIRPYAQPLTNSEQPKQSYLMGDLYVKSEQPKPTEIAAWQDALRQLEFGGERGYGWGRVELVCCKLEGNSEPIVTIKKDKRILAHAYATNSHAVTELIGQLEPLVGWERNNNHHGTSAWQLSSATICYAPGTLAKSDLQLTIGQYGLLEQ